MRRFKILLITLMLILIGGFLTNVNAEVEVTKNLKAQLTRPFKDDKLTNPKYKYKVKGSSDSNVDYVVIKIYDEDDKKVAPQMSNFRNIVGASGENELAFSKAYYCLRGGVGFGALGSSDGSGSPEPGGGTTSSNYKKIGEMHEDVKTIIENMKKHTTEWKENELGDGNVLSEDKELTVTIKLKERWIKFRKRI